MRTLQVIREAKAAKVAELRAMVAKAETEKRSLSADESASFDKIKGEITELEGEEQRATFLADQERRSAGVVITGSGGDSYDRLQSSVSVLRVLQASVEGRALSGAEAEAWSKALLVDPQAALRRLASRPAVAAVVVGRTGRQTTEPFRPSEPSSASATTSP